MSSTWVICIDGTSNEPGQKDIDPIGAEERVSLANVVRGWEGFTQSSLNADFDYGSIAPVAYPQLGGSFSGMSWFGYVWSRRK